MRSANIPEIWILVWLGWLRTMVLTMISCSTEITCSILFPLWFGVRWASQEPITKNHGWYILTSGAAKTTTNEISSKSQSQECWHSPDICNFWRWLRQRKWSTWGSSLLPQITYCSPVLWFLSFWRLSISHHTHWSVILWILHKIRNYFEFQLPSSLSWFMMYFWNSLF